MGVRPGHWFSWGVGGILPLKHQPWVSTREKGAHDNPKGRALRPHFPAETETLGGKAPCPGCTWQASCVAARGVLPGPSTLSHQGREPADHGDEVSKGETLSPRRPLWWACGKGDVARGPWVLAFFIYIHKPVTWVRAWGTKAAGAAVPRGSASPGLHRRGHPPQPATRNSLMGTGGQAPARPAKPWTGPGEVFGPGPPLPFGCYNKNRSPNRPAGTNCKISVPSLQNPHPFLQ